MIVDTDGESCVTVNFGIGGGTTARQWDIIVKFFSYQLKRNLEI